jgi:hypothetical protein
LRVTVFLVTHNEYALVYGDQTELRTGHEDTPPVVLIMIDYIACVCMCALQWLALIYIYVYTGGFSGQILRGD